MAESGKKPAGRDPLGKPDLASRGNGRTGSGPVKARSFNRRLLLRLVSRHGRVSRAELTRLSGLTAQAISGIVGDLIARGYLLEAGHRRGRRGQPAKELVVNPEGAFSIGVNLDRDHLTVLLLDLAGEVRGRIRQQVAFPTPEKAFALIDESVDRIIADTEIDRTLIVGLGLAIPGRHDPRRPVLLPPTDNPAWRDVAVAEELEKRLGIPVLWDNDATAAAIGEGFRGGGAAYRNFFYVHIGIGLGSGLILDGEPYRGWAHNAGEFGRIRVSLENAVDGEPRPRMSQVASLGALQARMASVGKDTTSPERIVALFEAGDADLERWLDCAGRALARTLCAVIYILDPEAVIMGGEVPAPVMDSLVARARQGIADGLFKWHGMPDVIRGAVGVDAGALGAATLPLYATFAPDHALVNKA